VDERAKISVDLIGASNVPRLKQTGDISPCSSPGYLRPASGWLTVVCPFEYPRTPTPTLFNNTFFHSFHKSCNSSRLLLLLLSQYLFMALLSAALLLA
jgi:hypothetical protein